MAILTASPTDVLSHIAIRARAQGVLLATCFDAEGAPSLLWARLGSGPALAQAGLTSTNPARQPASVCRAGRH